MVLFNLITLASFGVGMVILWLFLVVLSVDFAQGLHAFLAGLWTLGVDLRIRKKHRIEAAVDEVVRMWKAPPGRVDQPPIPKPGLGSAGGIEPRCCSVRVPFVHVAFDGLPRALPPNHLPR